MWQTNNWGYTGFDYFFEIRPAPDTTSSATVLKGHSVKQVCRLQSNVTLVRSRNIMRTGLGSCIAFALLILFISYKPHVTSDTKKMRGLTLTKYTYRCEFDNLNCIFAIFCH